MIVTKKSFFTLSLFILLTGAVFAQRTSTDFVLWRDSVATSVGATFLNRLAITNTSSSKQEITLTPKLPSSVRLLSTFPESLTLLPGEKVQIPIKGLVDNKMSSSLNTVVIWATDKAGSTAKAVSFQLSIKGKPHPPITLYTIEDAIVLSTPSQPAQLSLRLVHNRPDTERFHISITALPEGIDRSSFPLSVQMGPNLDTTLSIQVNPLHRWSADQPYQLAVTVQDERKSIVGSMIYKLVLAVDSKRFMHTDYHTGKGYGASTALSWFGTGQLAKEARVWGTDSLGKGQVDFNLQYLNYGADNFQQLQNSYITYTTSRAMIHLGSSYDYHELPLYGRGLKVSLNQPNSLLTFWAINSNPNWLSPFENTWAGNVVSVRYDRQLPSLPGGSYSLSSSYFTQENTMRTGYLNFASFRYDQSERQTIQVLVGQSSEFSRQSSNPGWSGLVNYSYKRPTISWQLRSNYSSPAYSGLQRGAMLLYSQLLWQPSRNTTLLARINYLSYNRLTYFSASDYTRHRFGNSVVEVDVNRRVGPFSFGLRPYWFSQNDFDNPLIQRADAYRIAPSLSYYRRSYQYINLSYDVGLFNTPMVGQSGWLSQRVLSTISLGAFSFWGYWQKGPYYLFDLRNDQPDKMVMASLTPAVNFSLANHKITGSVGLSYLYDGVGSGSRYLGVGRVKYDVNPGLSINLSGNGTPYSQQPEFSYSLYRLEVAKHFSQLTSKNRGKLRLSFFEDRNGNTRKDADERWMDSLLVTINENTLLTNAKGSITYTDIPPGTYRISAISANGVSDPVLYHEQITISRSASKQIGLARSFRVNGLLCCETSAYDNSPCPFNRFTIDVEDHEKIVTSTPILPDGTFSLHLSPGPYTLFVRDYSRQPQVAVRTIPFQLSDEGKYPVFDLLIDGATRPVEIKRFSSK